MHYSKLLPWTVFDGYRCYEKKKKKKRNQLQASTHNSQSHPAIELIARFSDFCTYQIAVNGKPANTFRNALSLSSLCTIPCSDVMYLSIDLMRPEWLNSNGDISLTSKMCLRSCNASTQQSKFPSSFCMTIDRRDSTDGSLFACSFSP